MKKISSTPFVLVFVSALAVAFCGSVWAQEKAPAETMSIKVEGAKMAPTPFSHQSHVDKAKLECKVCHHKAKDGKAYENCVACHLLKETKDGAPIAKDAFHKQCQGCHKESVKKGVAAPTKCNECHKK